ncbi:hypothetical protein ACFFIY_12520 [Bhargavaea ullalensis]|uniref:Uncharacterized protein n=1 Tax=Bhargavaea ullalensis TaxID=1265685 RepID=A0ABV2G7M8_9BACL
MTFYSYLATDRPLPAGNLGENVRIVKFSELPPTDDPADWRNLLDKKSLADLADEDVRVYDTELDAVFVSLTPVDGEPADRLPVSKPFVLQVDGIFEGNPESVQKCTDELLAFLRGELVPGEEAELYTCLSGEEGLPRNEQLDRDVRLEGSDVRVPLWFRDRQLVMLKR